MMCFYSRYSGGTKKITATAIVSNLLHGAISNVSEDTTPQLGG